MQIDAFGPSPFLEQLGEFVREQLGTNGFEEGPRAGGMNTGACWTFLKEEVIVSLQLTEAESGESNLHMECEGEVPELKDLWDDALIALGRTVRERIIKLAQSTKKVEQAI